MDSKEIRGQEYYVAFRIEDVGDYDGRRNKLIAAISGFSNNEYWHEPTSHLAFRSRSSIVDIESKVLQCVDNDKDFVFIRNVDSKEHKVIGVSQYPGGFFSVFDELP